MSQTTDGIDTTARQHGAKVLRLPLQGDGNNYATEVVRTMMATPASAYDPIVGERTGYTQLLKYSEDFSQSNWTKAATTGTANATTDMEGGTAATKLAEDNTNAAHNASQTLVVASGALAFGVLLKAGERSFARLRINNGTDSNLAIAVFNLSTGVVVSGTGTIKKLLNGWYWCYVTGTATVSNSTCYIDLSNDGSTFSYTGTTGSGIYAFRATCYRSATMGPAVLTTSATRAVTCGPIDPDDPLAFLVNEQEPEASGLEVGFARWTRTYANVPAQTIIPGSRFITKPDLNGEFPQENGESLIIQPEDNVPRWSFYTRLAVSTDSGYGNTSILGGTFTLTFGASTTSPIAYNASASTIQTALNALASIAAGDGVVVTGSVGGPFDVVFNNHAQPTADATSITVSSGGKNVTIGESISTLPPSLGFRPGIIISSDASGGSVTGGTFTVTFFGQTTAAIAYNATTAAAAAAINALSNVTARAGVTVVGASGSSTIFNATTNRVEFYVVYNALPAISGDASAIIPSSVTITNTNITTVYINNRQRLAFVIGPTLARTFTTASVHGFSLTDSLVVKMGTDFHILAPGAFTLPATNQVAITTTAGAAFIDSDLATLIGSQTGESYTGGSKLTRVKRVTDYYLPGVTVGVATIDDIPLPVYQGDDASLLTAIFDGDTDINYEVGELELYRGGPIVQRTRTTLDASQL